MQDETLSTHGAGHGSLRTYVQGFALSLFLTLVAFGVVLGSNTSTPITVVAIIAAAVIQILVQMHFFLHLDASSSQRWNVLVMVYTLIIIALLVGGSLWIMYNTGIRMMPMSMPMGH